MRKINVTSVTSAYEYSLDADEIYYLKRVKNSERGICYTVIVSRYRDYFFGDTGTEHHKVKEDIATIKSECGMWEDGRTMNRLYCLHDYINENFEIWASPQHVTHLRSGELKGHECTEINFDSGERIYVKESVSELIDLSKDWEDEE